MSTEGAIRIGEVIRGKYELERVIGAGGMGIVVAARQRHLDRQVAIKFLQPDMLAQPEVVTRFLREARAASRLRSPHAAHVVEVDTLEGGAPFLVMEYLEGRDLASIIEEVRRLDAHLIVDMVLQAADALSEAHSLGIVHRDVKPANLFLARQREGVERIKVLDFGISKSAGPADVSVTKTSAVMGSAQYMSPEQMRSSRDVDARSDVWSLGVVLYELLTGVVPFPGETITEVCARVFTEVAEPPQRSDMPPGLGEVVMKCLERDRERRFQSMSALITALEPYGTPAALSTRTSVLSGILPIAVAAPPTEFASPIMIDRGEQAAPPAIEAAPTPRAPAASGQPARSIARLLSYSAVGGVSVVGIVIASLAVLGGDGPKPVPSAVPVATAAPEPTTTTAPAPLPACAHRPGLRVRVIRAPVAADWGDLPVERRFPAIRAGYVDTIQSIDRSFFSTVRAPHLFVPCDVATEADAK